MVKFTYPDENIESPKGYGCVVLGIPPLTSFHDRACEVFDPFDAKRLRNIEAYHAELPDGVHVYISHIDLLGRQPSLELLYVVGPYDPLTSQKIDGIFDNLKSRFGIVSTEQTEYDERMLEDTKNTLEGLVNRRGSLDALALLFEPQAQKTYDERERYGARSQAKQGQIIGFGASKQQSSKDDEEGK